MKRKVQARRILSPCQFENSFLALQPFRQKKKSPFAPPPHLKFILSRRDKIKKSISSTALLPLTPPRPPSWFNPDSNGIPNKVHLTGDRLDHGGLQHHRPDPA